MSFFPPPILFSVAAHFISRKTIDKEEAARDIVRAEALRDAKIQHDRRVEAEERARKRKERSGEDTWINPLLAQRLEKKEKTN